MRVLVFGNINAGKSVVVSALAELYPDTPVVGIDDYRCRFGDGSHEGDSLAMDRFGADAGDASDAIVEKCLTRIDSKDFTATPYPPFPDSSKCLSVWSHNCSLTSGDFTCNAILKLQCNIEVALQVPILAVLHGHVHFEISTPRRNLLAV